MQKTRQEVIKLVLDTAKKEIGTKEDPPYSNSVKYNKWYYGNDTRVPWCATFVSWLISTSTGFNRKFESCPYWVDFHKKYKTFISKDKTPELGDIIFMAFSEADINAQSPAHVGIVVGINKDGSIQTIEGNTSDGKSQDNGGEVLEKTRYLHNIVGYGRHDFVYMWNNGLGKLK